MLWKLLRATGCATGLALGLALMFTVVEPVPVHAANVYDCTATFYDILWLYPTASPTYVNSHGDIVGPAYKTSEYDCANWAGAIAFGVGDQLCRDAGFGANDGYVSLNWHYDWYDASLLHYVDYFQQYYDCGDI